MHEFLLGVVVVNDSPPFRDAKISQTERQRDLFQSVNLGSMGMPSINQLDRFIDPPPMLRMQTTDTAVIKPAPIDRLHPLSGKIHGKSLKHRLTPGVIPGPLPFV